MVAVVWAGLALDWAWDVALLGMAHAQTGRSDHLPARLDRHQRRRSVPAAGAGAVRDAGTGTTMPTPPAIRAPGGSWTPRWPPSNRTRWSSAGGATPRRCGTAAGWRDARPDMTIIDDRTMLDEHLGSPGCDELGGSACMMDVIDGYLDERPVYLDQARRGPARVPGPVHPGGGPGHPGRDRLARRGTPAGRRRLSHERGALRATSGSPV